MNQQNFNELGYYLLCILYLLLAFTSFVSPAIVAKIGTKASLIIGATSYTFYVLGDLLPVVCYNKSISTGICSRHFIYFEAILVNVQAGICGSILWVAQAFAIKEREEGNATFLQGIFWMLYMGNNILGNSLSKIMNKNVNLQTELYIVLIGFALLSIIMLCFTPKTKKLMPPKPKEHNVCKSVKGTFSLIISLKLFPLLPFLLFRGALLTFYSGSFPRLVIHTMGEIDRFTQNQRTSFLFLFQGVSSALGGILFGTFTAKFTSKVKAMSVCTMGLVTFGVLLIFYIIHEYSSIWIVIAVMLGLSDGCINTFAIGLIVSEFASPDYQFGVLVTLKGFAMFLMYLVASFAIEKLPYALICGHIVLAVMAIVCFRIYKFKKPANEGKTLLKD